MSFAELQLIEPILRAVQSEGYTEPMPIQRQAIPHLLAGRDLIGCAQTGTGKTAAFALPMLQLLSAHPAHPGQGHVRPVRLLVLTPTRELASQIGDSFATYGKHLHLRHTVIFGGVGQEPQVQALRRGVDIVVATPGRLLDLMQQKLVRLDTIEVFILDEADRMLDMGFIHDVRRVIGVLPKKRQTLLFSATMPDEIRSLAASILRDPVSVAVAPVSSTADKIEQSVHFVAKNDKRALLVQLLADPTITRALVFTRTKHGANRVAEQLDKAGIDAMAIHGNKSQGARERALGGFKSGQVRVLVATDIAARGLDVDGISHVFNFDLPEVPEQYVHRIGRTARAGASGIAVSFCDGEERPLLADIERLIRERVRVAGKVTLSPASSSPPVQQRTAPPAHASNRPSPSSQRQAAPMTVASARPRHGSSGPSSRHPSPASSPARHPSPASSPARHPSASGSAAPSSPRPASPAPDAARSGPANASSEDGRRRSRRGRRRRSSSGPGVATPRQ